jgi:hypothetical protein
MTKTIIPSAMSAFSTLFDMGIGLVDFRLFDVVALTLGQSTNNVKVLVEGFFTEPIPRLIAWVIECRCLVSEGVVLVVTHQSLDGLVDGLLVLGVDCCEHGHVFAFRPFCGLISSAKY